MSKSRYLSVSETVRRFGVSGKALRIYEEKGLVIPERTPADWRVYGPDQIARLQQVIALKSFGLSLDRIGALLSGRLIDLETFLGLHEGLLRRQKEEVSRALDLVTRARAKLATDGHLSSDDLIDLTRKTLTMTSPDLNATYEAIAAKHLTPEDQSVLKTHGYAGMLQPDPDWDALHAEATRLMMDSAPESIEAMDLAKRWMGKVAKATGGDPALNQKVKALAREMHDTPEFQQHSKLSNAMMDYIAKAYGAAIAAGIMPKP